MNALLHQIEIGDFVDSNGHSAKMLKPVHDLMRLISESAAPAVREALPTYSSWVWKHTKSGGEYQLIGNATIQTDTHLPDMADVYVYQGDDGRMWVRPVQEFNERFKRIRPLAIERAHGDSND